MSSQERELLINPFYVAFITHTDTHSIVNISGRWNSFLIWAADTDMICPLNVKRLKPGSSFHLITKRIIDTHTGRAYHFHRVLEAHAHNMHFPSVVLPTSPTCPSRSGNPHTTLLRVFAWSLSCCNQRDCCGKNESLSYPWWTGRWRMKYENGNDRHTRTEITPTRSRIFS